MSRTSSVLVSFVSALVFIVCLMLQGCDEASQ